MNKHLHSHVIKLFVVAALVCFINTSTPMLAKASGNHATIKLNEDDKKKSKKARSSKSTIATVKVIPHIVKKAMNIVANSADGRDVDFYVFDVTGKMVANYKLKDGEKKLLEGLARGTYLYQVFCDDEQVSNGKIEFR